MTHVWLAFDIYEYYDAEDRIATSTDLIGVFVSRERAIKYIKEELIERHRMEIIDKDLEIDDEVYVKIPVSKLIHNYYIAVQHVQ